MRTITRQIVSALIFSSDNKLLMGMKDPAKGGVYSDCWHIPGGGIDDNENQTTALIREIKEETGLDVSNAEIELIDDQGRGATEKILKDTGEKVWCEMVFNIYKVKLELASTELKLTPTDDLVTLQWFKLADLENVKLTPPSLELFQRINLAS
jgi:8-oxo-dGTP pyrophosphatase MutT (NUDIX family)